MTVVKLKDFFTKKLIFKRHYFIINSFFTKLLRIIIIDINNIDLYNESVLLQS